MGAEYLVLVDPNNCNATWTEVFLRQSLSGIGGGLSYYVGILGKPWFHSSSAGVLFLWLQLRIWD